MTVPPIPVVPLRSVVLPVVLNIGPVSFCQVTPVGAIFVVVPVMVITVIPIVDSHLNGGFLRPGAGDDCSWRSNGRSQEQRTDVAIDTVHEVILQPEIPRFRTPVPMTMYPYRSNICSE